MIDKIMDRTISVEEYSKLEKELKDSVNRELRLESALHDCCKTAENQSKIIRDLYNNIDKMLKEVGL